MEYNKDEYGIKHKYLSKIQSLDIRDILSLRVKASLGQDTH
jgi:hypothetical protein